MTTTATLFPPTSCIGLSPKQHFLQTAGHEHAATLRVLRAYPDDALDLKPQEKCNSARDLAYVFVNGQRLLTTVLTTGIDWSSPPPPQPERPGSMAGIIDELEAEHGRVTELLRGMDDAALGETVEFMVAPKKRGHVARLDFLWMVLYDEIHHRGQFSIYLRIAGAKVPSIYGPTADEPWL